MSEWSWLTKKQNPLLGSMGIFLFILAWLLYLFLDVNYTIGIIFIHYLSFWIIAAWLRDSEIPEVGQKWVCIVIFSFSLCMDFFIYQPWHNLRLDFLYYLTVNSLHLVLLIGMIEIKKPFYLFIGGIQFLLWWLFFTEVMQFTIIIVNMCLIFQYLLPKRAA